MNTREPERKRSPKIRPGFPSTSSKLWHDTTRAIHALRAKEGDVAAMEAMIVAFMFATIAHPHGSLVKIKISYPYKFAPNLHYPKPKTPKTRIS
jgi:hypothetical protein